MLDNYITHRFSDMRGRFQYRGMHMKFRLTHIVKSAAVLCAATLFVSVTQLSATADTAPPVANDPTNPETVSAKPLPTVQIDGVVWSQTVVGNTVYVGGNFTTARPAGAAPGVTRPAGNLLAYDIPTGVLLRAGRPRPTVRCSIIRPPTARTSTSAAASPR